MRDARQVPDWIDGDLDHGEAAILVHDMAVGGESLGIKGCLNLRQIEARAGDRNGRADINALG